MTQSWVFENPQTQRISQQRQAFLQQFIPSLAPQFNLSTALDVGCGIGLFSEFLARLGLQVTAFDGREQNIAEAQRRFPHIAFSVQNVEDPQLQTFGVFDLVLCFGLLYHLENPFQAVRNLYALTGHVLLIETCIAPSRSPVAALVDEGQGEDQGLQYVALIPSESGLVKMLYRAGFPHVYKVTPLPDHEEFKATFRRKQRRTVLVAAQSALQSPLLQRLSEPHRPGRSLWKRYTGPWNYIKYLRRRVKFR